MASSDNGGKPTPADLTPHQMEQGVIRLKKRLAEVEEFEPSAVDPFNPIPAVAGIRASVDDAIVRTFGNNTVEYSRYKAASSFSWPLNIDRHVTARNVHAGLQRSKETSINLLKNAISSLEERMAELGEISAVVTVNETPTSDNRKVFLVHGHDAGPRDAVARYLAGMNFEPIILHEQVNQGRTIIEKFEHHADVGFAIVLLTPDDEGNAKGEALARPRARQNVILELGYFIGRLGRERVAALKCGDLELPSDILGVVWTEFDAAGGWKVALGKELKAAGYEVDWNKALG